MNRAYFLESKEADTPRIIFDKHCIDAFREIRTFSIFDSLIEADDKYSYFSLPTCLRYITTASSLTLSESKQLESARKVQAEMLPKIQNIIASSTSQRVKDKYVWLEAETFRTM